VHSINPADRLAAAHQQLVAIRLDPWVRRLALRYAGHPDVADDALQSAYYAVARLKNLEQIENLRAYFCKVLIHEVHRERGQLGACLVEDFVRVAEARQNAGGSHPISPLFNEDVVCTWMDARCWLERLALERDRLTAAVPTRSHDPDRYRVVIYEAAEQILRDGINAEPSEADANPTLRAAYPDYFDQAGTSPEVRHQRFHRARLDVRALLQGVVSHDELS
jgi:DNA-directed RNA polymerase specialized sigma24 family protein